MIQSNAVDALAKFAASLIFFGGASYAQVYKCTETGGSVKYQQAPCSSDAQSKVVEPQFIPISERIDALERTLAEIDKKIVSKHPNFARVFGGRLPNSTCRTKAGFRSKYDFSSDWKPVNDSALQAYQQCFDVEAERHDVDIQKSTADADWRARQEAARSRLPFPKVGMSAHVVRTQTMLGAPIKVNTTTTANGRREQWVYDGGTYLYFERDVLTAIQSR